MYCESELNVPRNDVASRRIHNGATLMVCCRRRKRKITRPEKFLKFNIIVITTVVHFGEKDYLHHRPQRRLSRVRDAYTTCLGKGLNRGNVVGTYR